MKRLTSCSIKIIILFTQIINLTNSQDTRLSKTEQLSSMKLNIINEFNVRIGIECYNITEYLEFQKLFATRQHIANSETETVKFHNCPLPDNHESLDEIFQYMGIFSYKNLFIKNDDYLNINNLKKELFKNIPQPQRLTLQLKYVSQLPADIFADAALKNLTTLDLYTNVTNLPNDIFAHLDNLLYLNLGHNLENLCDEQFRNQNKLLHLNLSNNKLLKISSNIFANNAAIQILQLENNSLSTLPAKIFEKLSSLTKIDINLNRFEYLPEKLFGNTSELKEFIFTKNRINLRRLPENFLANLGQLTKVEIRCALEALPAKIFFNSTNIKEIILNGNDLKQIPNELLESQSRLLYLDLSHNRLKEIPAGLFQKTFDLKILKLANNELKMISRNSLTHLKHLELVDLSCNQLNSQDFRIKLESSVNLKYLYLQNNSLTDLFVLLGHLPQNLRRLNLSFNKIFQLLGKDLEQLFTDNLILNLTYNRIETIQLQDFNKTNIHVVADVNNNPLICDCKIVESMAILEGLNKQLQFDIENLFCKEPNNLSGRYMKQINKMELLCMIQMTYLNRYKCPEQCNCWLRSYDKILMVDCSQKNLKQIPALQNIIDYDVNGIEINLTLNEINQLPTSNMPGYANCTKLFLAHNKLTSIDKTQIPENLTLLDLKANQLKYLSEDTLIYFMGNSLLKIILLSGNQWQCDCSDPLLQLYSATQIYNEKFTDASQMTCNNYPATTFIYELQDLCHQNEIILIIAVGFSLAVILLILILSLVYKNHIKIWLYGHNICLPFVTQLEDETAEKLYDAFVSYSHKDEDFIAEHLLPELENGEPRYKLCIHARDFLVGEYIPDQIVKAIAESRRVIVVLSKNFILSEWAKLEFKEAYRATLMERRQKLIVIMYEDIGKEPELDKELKLFLKMNTYLKWGDPRFWQKLRFIMPHKL